MLYDPPSHEPLTDRPWDEGACAARSPRSSPRPRARSTRRRSGPPIRCDLEGGRLPAVTSLYLGASGVIWALHELERARCGRSRPGLGAGRRPACIERYREQHDFPEDVGVGPVAAAWGSGDPAGRAHARARRAGGGAATRGSAGERREPVLGADVGLAGDDVAARVMDERTGGPQWLDGVEGVGDAAAGRVARRALGAGARREARHCLGPAHGFAGNVLALARGDLLDPADGPSSSGVRVAAIARYARREDGLASGRRRSSRPARRRDDQDAVVPRRPGIVAALARWRRRRAADASCCSGAAS